MKGRGRKPAKILHPSTWLGGGFRHAAGSGGDGKKRTSFGLTVEEELTGLAAELDLGKK